MKKNVSTKVLTLLLVAVLLVGCSIGGTLAWLMVKTDPLTNTFTLGDIKITLTEHVLDAKGQATAETTPVGNADIQAVPGRKIDKDPTVTVLAGSEPCYVRVLMKVYWTPEADNIFQSFVYEDWIRFGTGWEMKRIFDGTTVTNGKYIGYDLYEFRFTGNIAGSDGTGYAENGIVYAENGNVTLPVFTGMTFPATLTGEHILALEDCGIVLVAQAIQVETFADADAAWANMEIPEGFTIPAETPAPNPDEENANP